MFGVENIWLFVAAGLLLNITPGPDMLYVATRSTIQGRRAGIASALGIGGGSLVHTAAAALGVSALIAYSALTYTLIKWAGALYLIYLGIRSVMSAGQPIETQQVRKLPLARVFWQAVTINILNPKVAIFFLAFLPQFTNPDAGSVPLQILFLGTVFNFNGTVVNSLVGIFFGTAGNHIMSRPAFRRIQSYVTGTVFIGLGIHLALDHK